MHHLTLHITTFQNSENIFSAVHGVLYKNDYGVIFWMTGEQSRIDIGLVIKKETKQEVKEEINFYLLQNGIDDFGYSQPLNPQVNELWMQWYMPDKKRELVFSG